MTLLGMYGRGLAIVAHGLLCPAKASPTRRLVVSRTDKQKIIVRFIACPPYSQKSKSISPYMRYWTLSMLLLFSSAITWNRAIS